MAQLPAEKSTVGQWSLISVEEVSLPVVDTAQDSFACHVFVHDRVMLEQIRSDIKLFKAHL
jgi:hypothetical protein